MTATFLDIAADMPPGRPRMFVETFAGSSQLLQFLPVDNTSNGRKEVEREAELGSSAFRAINESYTPDSGRTETQAFNTKIVGGEVKVDTRIVARGGERARLQREQMKAKSMIQLLDYTLVNGDQQSNPKEFDGMLALVAGGQQEVANTGAGGALSLYDLDQAIGRCLNPGAIYGPRAMKWRLTQAARNTAVGGDIRWEKDAFGEQIMLYNGLPFLEADPPKHAQVPLGFTEGAGSNETSLYILSLDGTGLEIFTMGDLAVKDFGEVSQSPHFITRFEWEMGLALNDETGIVRLKGIQNKAVVV